MKADEEGKEGSRNMARVRRLRRASLLKEPLPVIVRIGEAERAMYSRVVRLCTAKRSQYSPAKRR
jgi:hypothetical protein